ncbi:MAG TPA: helix-turn-helix domain-containing protein [Aridibacter sp.]|nr:helix-turn-helix domain-containing protein [Aridibacter sp.]
METIQTDRLLTSRETADYLKTSTVTLWRMRKEGLPYHRIAGKILYRFEDLEEFIRSNRVGGDDE